MYTAVCERLAIAHFPDDVSGARTRATCREGASPPAGVSEALAVLHSQRARVILALDAAIGPAERAPTQTLLTDLLPLYDDGTLARHGASLAAAFHTLGQNPAAISGLSRLGARRGYVAAHADLGRAALAAPQTATLLPLMARVLSQTPQARAAVLSALHGALAQRPEASLQTLQAGLSAVATPLLAPAPSQADVKPKPCVPSLVRRDARGLAQPAGNGGVVSPFVDLDHDGLADVDSRGRFVDGQGRLLHLPTPFARPRVPERRPRGRYTLATRADGSPWWAYLSAQNTLLATVFDSVGQVVAASPQLMLGWAKPVHAILQAQAQSPLGQARDAGAAAFDVAWAQAAPQGPILADVAAHLLATQSQALAAVWRAQEAQSPWQPDEPDDGVGVRLGQDVLAWLTQVADTPMLLENLLEALADPATQALGPRLAAQMRHVDAIDFDVLAVNAKTVGTLHTPVSAQAPVSTFARLLSLVNNIADMPVCNVALDDPMPTYPACALFCVPDAAYFYLDALAGAADLTLKITDDDFFFPDQFEGAALERPGKSEMEAFSGLDGFVRKARPLAQASEDNYLSFSVTPQAAGRLLFALHDPRVPQDSLFGVTRAGVQQVAPRLFTRAGAPFDIAFQGTLFAWEQEGFLQAVAPLARAFVQLGQHDKLVGLMRVLDGHFAALSAQHPQWIAQLAAQLDEHQLLNAVGVLLRAADARQTALGRPKVWPVLAQALRAWVATPPGGGASPAATLWEAGRVVAAHTKPHALALGESLAPWLATGIGPDGQSVFLHQDILHTVQDVLRAVAHTEADAWDGSFRLTPWVQSPTVAALATLAASAAEDPAAPEAMRAWLAHLFTTEREVTLTAAADVLQLAQNLAQVTDVAQGMAQAFLGPKGPVDQSLAVVARTLGPGGLDGQNVVPVLLQRLHTLMPAPIEMTTEGGDEALWEAPISALWDVFLRVNRTQPGSTDVLDEADVSNLLATVEALLQDGDHGLVRLLDLVAARHPSAGAQ